MAKNTKRKKSIKKATTKTKWKRRYQAWQRRLESWYRGLGKLTTIVLIVVALLIVAVTNLNHDQFQFGKSNVTHTGPTATQKEFVARLVPTAQSLQGQYGVLPSISLAQAMLESDFGQSQLAATYHNLFGVKADPADPNGVNLETKEFVNNEWITIVDRFKVYSSWEESLRQHAELIRYGTSWNPQQYQAVLAGRTYREQANGLQSSGYATDPDYARKIIEMIEEWNLTQYDAPKE